MGIAVSTATDVAKSAAGIVLIEPGLTGIVSAIKAGRITFQRILSYALRSTSKKISQLLFLAIGLIMTGHAIVTPLLMVIVMIGGDFLAMAYATDNVRPSSKPNRWEIGRITSASTILGVCFLAFLTTVLAVGQFRMRLDISHLQTLSVIAIVYGSQAMTYAVRDRRHLWALRPTKLLIASSVADVLFISTVAYRGIAMSPLSLKILATEFAAAAMFCLLLNFVKIPVFARLKIS
jgi:H+-transporting ATPase